MRQELQDIFSFTITAREVIANTLMATVCGAIISFFYRLTFRGGTYSIQLIRSMVMLSMLTAFIMMVIGDNLARAFGMVGVLSIIQFKAAMKGAQDFMFLLYALAMGLACGAGLYVPSLVGCLLIGLITVGMTQLFPSNNPPDFTLTVVQTVHSLNEDREYKAILESFCQTSKLVSRKVSTRENGVLSRFSYVVRIRKDGCSAALVSALKAVEGVQEVLLEYDKE